MTDSETVLVTCPQGHLFVTLERSGHVFVCPDCDKTFDRWEGCIFDLRDSWDWAKDAWFSQAPADELRNERKTASPVDICT